MVPSSQTLFGQTLSIIAQKRMENKSNSMQLFFASDQRNADYRSHQGKEFRMWENMP